MLQHLILHVNYLIIYNILTPLWNFFIYYAATPTLPYTHPAMNPNKSLYSNFQSSAWCYSNSLDLRLRVASKEWESKGNAPPSIVEFKSFIKKDNRACNFLSRHQGYHSILCASLYFLLGPLRVSCLTVSRITACSFFAVSSEVTLSKKNKIVQYKIYLKHVTYNQQYWALIINLCTCSYDNFIDYKSLNL